MKKGSRKWETKCRTSGKVKTWFSSVKLTSIGGRKTGVPDQCVAYYAKGTRFLGYLHMKSNIYFKEERLAWLP